MDDALPGIEDRPVLARSAFRKILLPPIEAASAALVVGLIATVLVGVFFRYVLSRPLTFIDDMASFLFLWTAMVGTAIAIDRNEHIRLTLFVSMFPQKIRPFLEALALVVVIIFTIVLLPLAFEHVAFEHVVISPGLGIPNSYKVAAMPFGLTLILLFCFDILFSRFTLSEIAYSASAALAIGLLLWLMAPFFHGLGFWNILVFLVVMLLVCLIIGVPIAFCFGISTLSFLFFTTSVPLSVMIGRMDEGMSGLILLAIPIFILLGCILDVTGMGKAIVEFLSSMFGHVRAGMSYVLLGSLYLVSGISGSKISDMATIAPALFPEMKRRGNKPSEMVALLGTGAIMADTVPPSIMLIVLGSVAGLSIAGLFTSGFVIAFFLMLILAVLARWKSRHERTDEVKRAPFSQMGKTFLFAAPALTLPLMIRLAVGEGVATATEVSALAVVYAGAIGAVLYGGIPLKRFYSLLVETAALSGAILIIMGTALAAAWALTQTGFAGQLALFMTGLPGGATTFLLLSIVIFMVLGCLLEGIPALVLMAPLMFPIARSLDINGIHYAMVVVVSLNIGLFMPPIGIGYYLACSIGKVAPDVALKTIWTYLAALIFGTIAIALIPAISIGYL